MLNKLPNLDSIRSEILKKGYYIYNNFASSNDCILLSEQFYFIRIVTTKVHPIFVMKWENTQYLQCKLFRKLWSYASVQNTECI